MVFVPDGNEPKKVILAPTPKSRQQRSQRLKTSSGFSLLCVAIVGEKHPLPALAEQAQCYLQYAVPFWTEMTIVPPC
jgi:hypothetical protein